MTALVAEELGKRYAGRWVLDGVGLRVEAGERVAIVGANGAGKSTLLAIVAGAIEPDRGWVTVAGASLARGGVAARRALGYVPEAADPPGHLTASEVWALVAALRGAAVPDAELRTRLGLDAIAGQRIDRMSLGQRRRTCVAAALIGQPTLLVLDEPTNGLDVGGVPVLEALLRDAAAAGAAVVLASHDRNFLSRLGARVIELEAGRLKG